MSKKRFIIKRILQIIPMLFIASVLAFGLSHASRGEVANSVIRSRGMQPTPETIASVREELGLDKPVHIQYFSWLKDAVRLDFGKSFLTDEPVMEEIAQRFPNTLLLAVVTTLFSIVFGIFFAILSVKYKGPDSFNSGGIHPGFCSGIFIPVCFCDNPEDISRYIRKPSSKCYNAGSYAKHPA